MSHEHHHHHAPASTHEKPVPEKLSSSETFSLAMSATFHCLIGCGIGEVAGMIISTALGFSNLHSILLAVTLGFVAGLALGIIPLIRHGFSFGNAIKTVIVAEGLSIAVMEAFEVIAEVSIPGVMDAHLTDGIFWIGMIAALAAGFVAALPVNYYFVKRGIRHQH